MPRKSRKKAQPESPATEPTPIAAVLEASPAMEAIRASREAKAEQEPERPMPEPEAAIAAFQRQAMADLPDPSRQLPAPEADVRLLPEEPKSFAAAIRGMQPVPDGFRPISTFKAAGLRVNKSLDRSTVAIQFDEDYRAIRGGPNSEVELLALNGFSFEPARRQWERRDPENPGVNIVTAQRFGQELAAKRTGIER